MMRPHFAAALFCLLASPPVLAGAAGGLVIVGGGLRSGNEPILRAFLDRAGAGDIGIIPAASSKPIRTAERFRDELVALGLPAERVHVLPLAVVDDPVTPDTDESTWSGTGADPATAAQIDRLGGLWFTGGDQARIMRVLSKPDGGLNAAGQAVARMLERQAVVGGTSAGAAVMSSPMILGGTSPEALRHGAVRDYPGMQSQEDGPLILGAGLGLLPHALVDQHFDRKARLGRLVVALGELAGACALGVGIDEDTALVYDASTGLGQVAGTGTVTLVDARGLAREPGVWRGLRISVLTAGDAYDFVGLRAVVAAGRTPTQAAEYLEIHSPRAEGLLSPYGGRLEDALGFLLVDNRAATSVTGSTRSRDGALFRLTLSRDDRTRGFWTTDGEYVRYTILDAGLSIEAVP